VEKKKKIWARGRPCEETGLPGRASRPTRKVKKKKESPKQGRQAAQGKKNAGPSGPGKQVKGGWGDPYSGRARKKGGRGEPASKRFHRVPHWYVTKTEKGGKPGGEGRRGVMLADGKELACT